MYLTQKELAVLEEVYHVVLMRDCSFRYIVPMEWQPDYVPLPKSEKDVDEFIRERTKLWRESWILSPLREILKRHDGDVAGGANE